MIITLNDVRAWDPCYDPAKYNVSRAKLSTVLKMGEIPLEDRVWVACYALAKRDRELLIRFVDHCIEEAESAAIYDLAPLQRYVYIMQAYQSAYNVKTLQPGLLRGYHAYRAVVHDTANVVSLARKVPASSVHQTQINWLIGELEKRYKTIRQ